MKALLSNLLQNRMTGVAVLLLLLMTITLGQSVRALAAAPPPCGTQICTTKKCPTICPVCRPVGPTAVCFAK